MSRLYWLFLILGLSCSTKTRTEYISVNHFFVENIDNSILVREDGVFRFYQDLGSSVDDYLIVGGYENGFRNDKWIYKENRSSRSTVLIEWDYFDFGDFKFETNLFKNVDSSFSGYKHAIVEYKIKDEKIKFKLGKNLVSKAILKIKNPREIFESDFAKLDYEVLGFKKLPLNLDSINVFEYSITNKKNSKKFYFYTAYILIQDSITIDFCVQSNQAKSKYAKLLFDGILSNSYYDGVRLFNPWTGGRYHNR